MSKTLIAPHLIAQGFGQRPDIVIATNAMQLDENAPSGVPVLSMIGSSTVKDMQRDTMQLSALQDMTAVPLDMTIWLNHNYNLPDDVFGKLHDRPTIKTVGNIADLSIRVEVETENPPAARTFNMILRGKKFGCSVGCQVTDYDFDGASADPYSSPLLIKHVTVVEWSVVGIPANQRCWVEQALKGLFERSLVEGRAEDVLRLAPAYKGLYWRDFERVVRNVEHVALKKDLERISARSVSTQFLLWDAVRDTFQLNGGPREVMKSLTRAEASALLDTLPVMSTDDADDALASTRESETPARVAEAAEPLRSKGAAGKANWPLGDRSAAWDGGAAHNRVVAWASDTQGTLDAKKMQSVHFWYDDSAPEKITSYKLLFCDIKGGTPVAMPRAIFACAGSHGIASADIPSGDLDAVKAKIAAYYRRMATAFHDEQIVAPWETETKAKAATNNTDTKDILDSGSGGPLNRQDLDEHPDEDNDKKERTMQDEEMAKAKDVEVAEDGTHAPCVGSHLHKHASYAATTTKSAAGKADNADEAMHSHAHSHNGDAHHGHEHEDGNTSAGAEDESEDADADAGEDGKQAHAQGKKDKTLDPAQATLLKAYNTIGEQLGLPQVSLTKDAELDLQGVVTALSRLDQYIDRAADAAQDILAADQIVDALMAAFGVPDIDDDDDDDMGASVGAGGPLSIMDAGARRYSLDAPLQKALAHLTMVKEGRAINAENREKLQMIHECVKAIHPDCCKAAPMGDGTSHQDGSVSVDEARRDANFQMGNMAASWVPDLLSGMQSLAKALNGANISGIQLEITTVTKTLHSVQKQLRGTQGELSGLQSTLNALKEVPLGKPTSLNRTVAGEASYEDMRASGSAAQKGLAPTDLLQKNGLTFRHWAAGVGVGQRPALSGDEMSLMLPAHISAYYEGLDADVPLIDTEVAQ